MQLHVKLALLAALVLSSGLGVPAGLYLAQKARALRWLPKFVGLLGMILVIVGFFGPLDYRLYIASVLGVLLQVAMVVSASQLRRLPPRQIDLFPSVRREAQDTGP